jgi:receptor protein-tyrosine kinase
VSLRDSIERARRWWWVLLVSVLAGGAGAWAVSTRITERYSATAQITVNQVQDVSGLTYSAIIGNESLTRTYARLIISSKNLERAQTDLGGRAIDASNVSASAVPNTFLIEVTVTDNQPARAAELANAIADVFPEFIKDVQLSGTDANGRQLNTVFVSEPAAPSDTPVSPNYQLNVVLGSLLALLLVAGAIGVFEYLDDRVRSREDLDAVSVPFVGSIPRLEEPARGLRRLFGGGSRDMSGPFEESFRQLTTGLVLTLQASQRKTIVITSAVPSEGKSTVAVNVGWAISRLSVRTLVIDGDLRRPSVHGTLGLPNRVGLTTGLVSGAPDLESLIVQVAENLYVLTSGPISPNPGEIITTELLTRLMGKLEEKFDLIIIDSPPFNGLADASLWLLRADGCMLVVAHGQSRPGPLKSLVASIESTGVPLIGAILNFVPSAELMHGYSYDYSYRYAANAEATASPGRRLPNRRKRRHGRAPVSPPDLIVSSERSP